jgi:hypothetical protein
MRMRAIAIVIGFSLGASGCSVVKYSAIDLTVPAGQVVNRWRNRCYERRAADAAWKQFEASCPGKQHSEGFCDGFKKGFVEYVDANGTGVPPGMPPPCYRNVPLETPAGRQIIADWYAGYAQGSAAGQASGLRSLLVVPPSDMLRNSIVAPIRPVADSGARLPASPDLPTPRMVPAPEDVLPDNDNAAAANRAKLSGAAPAGTSAP